MPAKVAPPLKSERTKFRVSEVWVTARPRTRVRSSSDLPEPVAPTHRPCGPHAVLGRLLEVEHDGFAVFADADGDAEAFGGGARAPGAGDVHQGRVAEVEHVGEIEISEQGFVVVTADPEGRKTAGEYVGLDEGEAVGLALVHDVALRLEAELAEAYRREALRACRRSLRRR